MNTWKSKHTFLVPVVVTCLTLQSCATEPASGDGGTLDAGADGGFSFRDFVAPATGAINNTFLFTVSGESFASEGLGFPPAVGTGEPYFVDGWEVKFSHAVVTIDHLRLSENPDLSPSDQSKTGPTVALAAGPWAVDLAVPGPLDAKELNGKAVALVRLTSQNQQGGSPAFDVTTRYAFGFDLLAAQSGAYNVNLDADAQAAYRQMVEKQWSVWISGTATWRGASATPACRTSIAGYDFDRLPKVVNFSFGFAVPVSYLNCDNPEGNVARGVQSKSNDQTIVQATFHLDHPFWEALEEDAPLRWDALAARKSVANRPNATPVTLTQDDLVAVDFQSLKDAQNTAVPWRYCGASAGAERTTGTVTYDPHGVAVSPAGGQSGLKDLGDYMRYNLSTFGHLNNDGLCYPQRRYPSPQ